MPSSLVDAGSGGELRSTEVQQQSAASRGVRCGVGGKGQAEEESDASR
jgi:hypothetical protein